MKKWGIIEAFLLTKITIKVAVKIDKSSLGKESFVSSPKGTFVDTSAGVYGIKLSAFGNNLFAN